MGSYLLLCESSVAKLEGDVLRMIVVFETDDVTVTASLTSSNIAIFSFSAWTKTPPAPAFGMEFIAKNELSGIYFQAKKNDWWNNSSMEEAIRLANQLVPIGVKRIAFGSSMGAYAALVFGPLLGCSDYVAISPQFSVEKAIVPWEGRWTPDNGAGSPNTIVAGTRIPYGSSVHLLYDPYFVADRMHVELIADKCMASGASAHHWRFGLSGHPTGQALVQTKQLSYIILSIFNQTDDARSSIREFRANRRTSRAVAQTLLTNRVMMERHPVLVLRAVQYLGRHQAFDDGLLVLLRRLEERVKRASDRHK